MKTLCSSVKLLLLSASVIAAASTVPVRAQVADSTGHGSIFEWFPILMYDTDVGFGAGGKVIFLDFLEARESFKLTAFASTKGERWLRLENSWPDTELRQGSTYPFSFDIVVDYDKMIHNNFFGVGNGSRYEHRETYTREPLDLQARFGRGFSRELIGQLYVRYLHIWSSGFDPGGRLTANPESSTNSRMISGGLQFRFDTRDSYIHPHSGFVLQADVEYAPDLGALFVTAARGALWLQGYEDLWNSGFVLAGRLGLQSLFGDGIPVQFLIPVGGNNTVRGLPQDRLLDKSAGIANVEFRVPAYGRFGAVAAIDAGRVWTGLQQLGLSGWTATPVIGLRYNLDFEVVRMDVGFGPDAVGLYFNFSHIF